MNRVVIGLGSNINPEQNIKRAIELLSTRFNTDARSEFTVTKPVGFEDQSDFINGAIALETDLELELLEAVLAEIETGLGRKRGVNSFGPRTIDLDIVVWNGEIIDNDFYDRDFLRKAAIEVFPGLRYQKNEA